MWISKYGLQTVFFCTANLAGKTFIFVWVITQPTGRELAETFQQTRIVVPAEALFNLIRKLIDMKYSHKKIALSALALCIGSHLPAAFAADSRSVKTPVIPASCSVLSATNGEATASIQKALNACAKGKSVRLVAKGSANKFYAGPLQLPSGVGLWVDQGVTLLAKASPTAFDNGGKTCGTLDKSGKGCQAFITVSGATGSGIYGKGTIDGQGGVVMEGKNQSWWQLATEAKTKKLSQNAPRLIQINSSRDIKLYQITLKNSPNFHVVSDRVDGLTAWGITINTPGTARNTDGFDPISSQNVTLINSSISTGDDNVAIKAGNNGPTRNISIVNNKFGVGHGMSIGSETNGSVSGVDVNNLTLNGTTSGLRIKSDRTRGGVVSGVKYNQVCMQNVKNPIVMDTQYENNTAGNRVPTFRDITLANVTSVTSGAVLLRGISSANPIALTLQGVYLAKGTTFSQSNATLKGRFLITPAGKTCAN